jgi:2-hydroxychromene-2-carboxylate isomerase
LSELVFFYSPGSRYSFLALTQMQRIEAEHQVEFDWIPTVGARIRELRGADPFSGPPQSGQYDWEYRRKDAEAWADYYGVEFREPRSVEFDARLLSVAAESAKAMGAVRDYSRELASEVFARNGWPIDRSLCIRVAASIGLPTREFEEAIDATETADRVARNCQSAYELGVFGNPTFCVDDAMFWGQDRLVLVERALERRATLGAQRNAQRNGQGSDQQSGQGSD